MVTFSSNLDEKYLLQPVKTITQNKISVFNTVLSHAPPVVKEHDTLLTHVNGISCHTALLVCYYLLSKLCSTLGTSLIVILMVAR